MCEAAFARLAVVCALGFFLACPLRAQELPPVLILEESVTSTLLAPDDTLLVEDGMQMLFDATGSYDQDEGGLSIVKNYWYKNGPFQTNSPTWSVTFLLTHGEYQVIRLRIADDDSTQRFIEQYNTIHVVEELPSQQSGREYYLTDHLGSIRATIDSDGDLLSFADYYPFGLVMPQRSSVGTVPVLENFTGHELDDETGLLYAEARFLDPVIGRWLSVDPLADIPAQYDKSTYAYSWNNPAKWNDPDGRCIPLCIVAAWAVVEIGLAIYDAYDVYTTVTDPNATTLEKSATVGGAMAGLFLPGGGYSAVDDAAEFGAKRLLPRFSKSTVNDAQGLVGKEFEDFLVDNLGGTGGFKVGGRQFDAKVGSRWIEAKSAGFWNLVSKDSDVLAKFKSTIGQQNRIAADNDASFELITNGSIPQELKEWLADKGIQFSELVE